MPPELRFHYHNRHHNNPPELRFSGYRPREASPDDSLIHNNNNNNSTSLFSSATVSVDRSSSASDFPDHDSSSSDFSQQMRAHDLHQSSSGGPDPDPNKFTVHTNKGFSSRRVVDNAKGHKVDSETEVEDDNQALDSARRSFSLAIRECQERRSRSESISRKSDRPRPASLDLNNHGLGTSPRFGALKKTLVSTRSGTFPSPVTPNYRHTSVGMQKGWSSERVPLPNNGNRKNVSGAFLPFNNGRTLPSKWEDAERWIFSPVSSGDGVAKHSVPPPHRKPKAKSGPLGPPGVAYYSLYSPAMPMFEAGNMGNLMASSPFSAGVMGADAMAIQCSSLGGSFPPRTEPSMARSASMHGCSEMLSLTHGSQEDEYTGKRDAATNISRDVSRRDMATQMSPEGSTHSSSLRPSTSSELQIVELQSLHLSKSDVRDVQVDERVTVTRWSKKHRALITGRGSDSVHDWPKNGLEARSAAWEVSETAKSISRVKREDARITAWENLQKAKAEAEIRKLEMKLEKKRSSSMDKIMNKLRSAQRKAQDMRSSVLSKEATHQVTRSSHKAISFRRPRQMTSLSGCFTCHAF